MLDTKFIIAISEFILLVIANIFISIPFLLRLVFRPIKYFHKGVSSDIPGNPHCFSHALISLLKTIPEPSNFNLVWTGIDFTYPIIIRGVIPKSRISSFSLYPRSDDFPKSIELLAKDKSMRFEIHIERDDLPADQRLPEKSKFTHNIYKISSSKWKFGYFAMRNYLVPPGTVVKTPLVFNAANGDLIRPSEDLIAGGANLVLRNESLFSSKEFTAMLLSILILVMNKIFLSRYICSKLNALIVLLGYSIHLLMYQLFFVLGKKSLAKFLTPICPEENKFVLASIDQSTKGSQPSRLHKYWVSRLNIPKGDELCITGRIDPTKFKYWSLIIYDEFGLPLPGYINDENVTRIHAHSHSHDLRQHTSDPNHEYRYDIRLTTRSLATVNTHLADKNLFHDNKNELNVSSTSHFKGFAVFRIVHPVEETEGFHAETFAPHSKLLGISLEKLKEQ